MSVPPNRPVAAHASGLLIPLAVVILCEAAFRLGHLKSDTLAPPSLILVSFIDALSDGTLLATTRDTLITTFGGLACGGLAGLALGTLFGSFRRLDRLFRFPIELIRPIPSVALIPIAMIVAGFGYTMEMAVVSFAATWPVLITTRSAIAEIEPRLIEVARVLRLGVIATTFKIMLPAALPRIFIGIRLAAGVALIVSVTVEIAANPIGLGHAIMLAQQSLQPGAMLALLVWIGVVGVAINSLLVFLQARLFGRTGSAGLPR
ncbi:ABC transporter permease [Bradyrhizobium sp.]|uniref:ABC transporter permease n=1 Tax=Bradyrhizobium sp. TaxID=376 RepID=UPI003C456A39